jgi:hypothetical protein
MGQLLLVEKSVDIRLLGKIILRNIDWRA